MRQNGFLAKIYRRLFGGTESDKEELLIEDPEQPYEEEIKQGTDRIGLDEQMRMIRIVDEYMEQFVFPDVQRDASWRKGFALQNELFVTLGEEPVYRSNMEVFFQDRKTRERKIFYLVSLVRFEGDQWRVFQVKG